MAGYQGHIGGGLAVGVVYVIGVLLLPGAIVAQASGLLSGWQTMAGLLIVAMLFSLWPDIDTNSRGQDVFFGTAFVCNILLIWQGYLEASAYLGLLAMTPIVGKHRGWTHNKLAMILVPLPIALVPYLYRPDVFDASLLFYGAAVAGYFSHLLLDGEITKHFRIKT